MSRKYCSSCGIKHNNSYLGMCDTCLQKEEIEHNEQQYNYYTKLKNFLNLTDDEKWEKVFDAITERGSIDI